MIKFIFWPGSLEGLTCEIIVFAHTYEQARQKALKNMYLDKPLYIEVEIIKPWPEM